MNLDENKLSSRELARKASREIHRSQNDNSGKRDRLREHMATKFILKITHGDKPEEMDFADWLHDGIILMNLMTTLDFNSIPRDPFSKFGGTDPEVSRIKLLIKAIETYGVKPKFMFTVDDLYKKNNIAKVTRCLEEIDKLALMDDSIVCDILPSNKAYI